MMPGSSSYQERFRRQLQERETARNSLLRTLMQDRGRQEEALREAEDYELALGELSGGQGFLPVQAEATGGGVQGHESEAALSDECTVWR